MDIKPNRPIRVGNKMMRTGADKGNLLADIDAAREELAAEQPDEIGGLRAIVAEMIDDTLGTLAVRIEDIETRLRSIAESSDATKSEQSVLASAVNDLGAKVSSLRVDFDKIKLAPPPEKTAAALPDNPAALPTDKAAKTQKPE